MPHFRLMPFAGFVAIFVISVVLFPSVSNAESKVGTNASALQRLTPLKAGALNNYSGGFNFGGGGAQATDVSKVFGNTITGGIGATGDISGINLNGINGMSTIIANSGNQVSIAQSTAINVYIH